MVEIISSITSFSLFFITGITIAFIIKKNDSSENIFKTIETLFFSLALPSILFVQILKSYDMQNPLSLLPRLFLLALIIIFASALSVFILRFTVKRSLFKSLALCILIPNAFMIPVLFIYDDMGLSNSVMSLYAIFSIFFIPAYLTAMRLFGRIKSNKEALKKSLSLIFISQVLALFISATSLYNYLPWMIYIQFETIQLLTIPLIVLLLGFYLIKSLPHLREIDFQNTGIFLLLKHILIPLITFISIYIFNIEYKFAVSLLLIASSPMNPIFLEENEDKKSSHQIFFFSMLCSALLIPLSMYLLNLLY